MMDLVSSVFSRDLSVLFWFEDFRKRMKLTKSSNMNRMRYDAQPAARESNRVKDLHLC
jgi:hypothetical protein